MLGNVMRHSLHAKRVTFRKYGLAGEKRRPMFHRFEVKGGVSVASLMADNILQSNTLLRRLMGGRHAR